MIVTHGWPGSIIEQLKIIDPLTNPTAHGASASDAFHLVIPSLPGYGFSGKPTTTGWDPIRIARAWAVLMQRLGYTRYVAQGGDWGNAVTEQMALQAACRDWSPFTPTCLRPYRLISTSSPLPTLQRRLASQPTRSMRMTSSVISTRHGLGYAQEMADRPQTLYGIEDSPIGLAAWMVDHDERSYALIARVFDGKAEGLTREDIVDNITLYWLTNTAVSSARLYWESKLAFFAPKGITLPVAVSAYPDELYQAPRSWAEKAYPKLIHYNRLDKGGHFAAWEQPASFSAEMRAAFKSLRQSS